MKTITLQMMAITISAKIMMVMTINHQMDRSKFDGIHRHHPSLFISIYPIIFRNWIFFKSMLEILYVPNHIYCNQSLIFEHGFWNFGYGYKCLGYLVFGFGYEKWSILPEFMAIIWSCLGSFWSPFKTIFKNAISFSLKQLEV